MKEEKETHTIGFDVELGWQGEVKRKMAYVLP
jgi:hypothetical protein